MSKRPRNFDYNKPFTIYDSFEEFEKLPVPEAVVTNSIIEKN
jgi:hypothetical protein